MVQTSVSCSVSAAVSCLKPLTQQTQKDGWSHNETFKMLLLQSYESHATGKRLQ